MGQQYDEEYKKYLRDEYRKEILNTYHKNQDSFEKQLSYLCAGTIGVSFLFIEHVVHDIDKTKTLWMLFGSWILLACTFIMNIISHKISTKIQYKTIIEIDKGIFDSKKSNKRNTFQHNINNASLVCMIAGILLFLIYTAINLYNMSSDKQQPSSPQPNTETGQKSSVPGPARDYTPQQPSPVPQPAPAPSQPSPPPTNE